MKTVKLLGYLFLGTTMSLGTVSCGPDNNNTPEKSGTEIGSGTGTGSGSGSKTETTLNQEEQKNQIEITGKKFVAQFNADDFKPLQDLAKHIEKNYQNQKQFEEVNKWAGDILKDLTTTISRAHETERLYTLVIDASKFKGHFEFKNDRWKRTKDSDNLEFQFRDQNGQDCLISLGVSGKMTRLKSKYFNEEDYNYVYDPSSPTSERRIYKKREYTLVVPEHVTLLVKQGNKELLTTTVNTNLTTKGELDLTADALEVNSKTVVLNKYEITAKRAYYKGPGNAEADVEIKADGKSLLTAKAKANGQFTKDGFKNVGAVDVDVNIFNEIELKGNCKNGTWFTELADSADEAGYNNNKELLNRCLADANSLIDFHLYYKNSSKPSAQILLGSVPVEKTFYKDSYLRTELMIKFDDKTTYAIEDYFTENNFKGLIKEVTKLGDSFSKLFDF